MEANIELELLHGTSAYFFFNKLIIENSSNSKLPVEKRIEQKKELFTRIKNEYLKILQSDLDNTYRNPLEPVILYFCGKEGEQCLASFGTGKLNRTRAICFEDYCDELNVFFRNNPTLIEHFDQLFASFMIKPLYDFKLNYLEDTNAINVFFKKENHEYTTWLRKQIFLHRKHQKRGSSAKTSKKREQELIQRIGIDSEFKSEIIFDTEETLLFYESLLEKNNGNSGSSFPLTFMRSNLYQTCRDIIQTKTERSLLIELFELLPYYNPFRDYYIENGKRISKKHFVKVYGSYDKYNKEEKYKMAHSYFKLAADSFNSNE